MTADTTIQSLTRDGVRWQVAAAHFGLFKELVAGKTGDIFASKDCVLKENVTRAIACVRRGEGPGLFVKKFKKRGFIGLLRLRLGKSQAHQEWRNLLEAKKRNMLVPDPVCLGVAKDCAYLATIEIPGARPLIEILRSEAGIQGNVVERLAARVAEMHDAGLVHNDLHLGNFLVSPESPEYILIDLHRARFVEEVSVPEAAANLGQLFYSLSLTGSEEDCEHLLEEYVKTRNLVGSGLEEASAAEAHRWGMRHERSRTGRCLRNSSGFIAESKAGRRIFRRRDADIDPGEVLDEHRKTLAAAGPRVLKDSPKSRLTVYDRPSGGRLVVKQHKSGGASGLLEVLTRGSRLRREWVNANGLAVRGHKTPLPLALVEDGPPWNRNAWLICEYLTDAQPLDEFLRDRFGGKPDSFSHKDKAQVLRALAGEIRRLHDGKIYHKDMKANNIMVLQGEEGVSFFFLDLDRVRFDRELDEAEIAAALAALNAAVPNFISLSDRMLFYRAYRRIKRLDEGEKRIIGSIVRRSAERNHFWRPPCQ